MCSSSSPTLARLWLRILIVAGAITPTGALAQDSPHTEPVDESPPATASAAPVRTAAPTEAQLAELRALLQSQQAQLAQLRTDAAAREARYLHDRERLLSGPNQLQRVEPSDQAPEAKKSPASVSFKGVTLTPGGFAAGETLWRSHAQQNDMISTFSGLPWQHDPRTQLSEFRGSARQSRLSLLAEGRSGRVRMSGYWEVDFLGAAPNANENQASGFQPRQRQLYAEIAVDSGWTASVGQTWSLITMNERGAATRTKWSPATIEAQYVVGYDFARLYTARLTKSLAHERATVALSAETPATLVGGAVPKNVSGVPGGVDSQGVGSLNNGVSYTTGMAPDLIGKLALDPGHGHYELKGVLRGFRDHVVGGPRHAKLGGGVGGGTMLSVWPERLKFIAQGLYGYGVARYHDSGTADVVVRPNGGLQLVQSASVLAGFELHALPNVDLYVFGGSEYQGRTYGVQNGVSYGYGNPSANLSGCLATSASFACSADWRDLEQLAAGVWWKPLRGDFGSVQLGLQYSYTVKRAWSGLRGAAGAPATSPRGEEQMFFTSVRYNIP